MHETVDETETVDGTETVLSTRWLYEIEGQIKQSQGARNSKIQTHTAYMYC